LFGYAVGPHSWKKFLLPATQRLWSAERTEHGMAITPEPYPIERFAFIGVCACDLNAIAIQDRVLIGGAEVDPRYQRRRQGASLWLSTVALQVVRVSALQCIPDPKQQADMTSP
jgi:hypothetical protein